MSRNPSILARGIETRQIPGGTVDYKFFPSPSAMLAWVNAHDETRQCSIDMANNGERWCGLGGQSIENLLSTGKGENSLRAFSRAQAKLEAEFRALDRPQPAIAGGAWVIPSVLAGNPMSARMKPRTRLPHKDFRFMLQVSAFTHQEDLSAVMAKIARAAWDYTLAGGTVSLTMFYVYGYRHKGEKGEEGLCIEMQIPLNDSSALALALSCAVYRPVLMGIASKGTSPCHNDSIPMKFHLEPQSATLLRGEPREDFPRLAQLGIK